MATDAFVCRFMPFVGSLCRSPGTLNKGILKRRYPAAFDSVRDISWIPF